MDAKTEEINTNIKSLIRKNGKPYSIRSNRNRIFTPEEWKKFYDILLPSQKLTFYILLITGARIMEVQHLKKEDVDFSNQRLILTKVKQRTSRDGTKKLKSPRTIRVNKRLIRMLKKDINEGNIKEDGRFKILSTPAANIGMKKALKKAGIKDWRMFSVHSVRKTSETWALSLDVDSMKLSKRFGHNLITAYQHYTQSDAYTYKERDLIKNILEDTYLLNN